MSHSPWLETLFRPLVIGVMFGCVALSLVGLVRLFVPTWNAAYLIGGCVLAALEANYSYRLVKARGLRGTQHLRFRAVELAVFFVLLKIGRYVGHPWADVLAEIQTWTRDPLRVLDGETTAAFILVLLAWHASTETVRDLERLGEPVQHSPLLVPPMVSLSERFFWGGAALVIASGLTRIGVAELFDLHRPSVPGLVLNVLTYFLLGLVMLGQVWQITLRRWWQAQEIGVPDELSGRWARYSLALVGLAAALAFLLPTGYTLGLLDVVRFGLNLVIAVLSFIFQLLFLLATLPLAWLLSKLLGDPILVARRRLPPLVPPQQPLAPIGRTPDWFEILRSLLFWVVALGIVYYVVRSYVRDHPELLAALGPIRPIQALRRWWGALWRWLAGWAATVGEHLPRGLPLRMARRREPGEPFRFFRLGALSPRERVLYYYLSIVRRAGQRGFPRQRAQTPYEFHAALEPNLPEVRQEMALLTQAFVEARYSQHAIAADWARQVRAGWQRVKQALRAVRRTSAGEDLFG